MSWHVMMPQVSTEAPKFKTVAADGVMVVVRPPGAGPALSWLNIGDKLRQRLGGQYGVRVGERWATLGLLLSEAMCYIKTVKIMNVTKVKGCFFRLRIGCRSGESFPASNLTFYINDEIANDKNVRKGRSHFADNRGSCKSSFQYNFTNKKIPQT